MNIPRNHPFEEGRDISTASCRYSRDTKLARYFVGSPASEWEKVCKSGFSK